MSQTNSAQPTPNPPDQPIASSSGYSSGDGATAAAEPWETINFPDQLMIEADPPPVNIAPDWITTGSASDPGIDFAGNPQDLITLIQDLNQCNDALLARVGELEEYLERSQTALQSELERSQSPTPPTPPASAATAQLLQELDLANDGLRRTAIHNQTLQAELAAEQQRVAQLEREFTLLQQRFSEKSAALMQAEESCRDLRSRLHRQQHYTLQFKAALEKCLNTDHPPASPLVSSPAPSGFMPRSGEIKPWSAQEGRPAHLQSLLRSLRQPEPPAQSPEQPPSSPQLDIALAQDSSTVTIALGDAAASLPEPTPDLPPVTAATPQLETAPDPWQTLKTRSKQPGFTEPSPWGVPLTPLDLPAEIDAQPVLVAEAPTLPAPENLAPAYSSYLQQPPAILTTEPGVSPSPVVYPLRSPKKISSLAAVQLPSFGRPRSQ